ncbi:MAG: SusC/RagA family TonB-linked outer membrane protein [Chitinophagaceae bacterium]|nr:SusC/RagA family TonB-linked outer membrane protein [Chitinophagaceae bacterium]
MRLTALSTFLHVIAEPLNARVLRIMKLTAIILLTACLQVSARSEGQTVTLKVKDVTVKKVFKEIQKQTGLNIFIDEAVLAKAGKVTLNVKDMPVAQVVNLCLSEEDYSLSIVEGTIVIKEKIVPEKSLITVLELPPPPIDVHGRVVNDKGEPLEGVTVVVKGTKKATFTDANGDFSLRNVNNAATLVFSGVNVETYELPVNNKTDLAINLKTKVTVLSDLAITANTGYQTIPREEQQALSK